MSQGGTKRVALLAPQGQGNNNNHKDGAKCRRTVTDGDLLPDNEEVNRVNDSNPVLRELRELLPLWKRRQFATLQFFHNGL
jgi:hypothetical protein